MDSVTGERGPMRIERFLMVGIVTLALAACAQKSEQTQNTTTAENATASATSTAAEVASVNLNVPLYPGASVKHFSSTTSMGGVTKINEQTALQTSDSFDKVDGWYKAQLKGWINTGAMTETNSGGTTRVDGFRSGQGADATVVGITSSPSTLGKTWISIIVTKTK